MRSSNRPPYPLWLTILCGAAAGGMGWGIRGQYGHETGAMLAGVLVGFALLLCAGSHLRLTTSLQAVALLAIGVGFGGSETYGQTIGLTQNHDVIGNTAAWAWGMLGLFIKGGLWIGIAGAFFGSALGGIRWNIRTICTAITLMMLAFILGEVALNTPFDPLQKKLPPLYFSADWYWQPNAVNLKPRPERWGGLLFAWLTLLGYRGIYLKDILCLRFGMIGFLAGGVGFAGGQCWQSAHAWYPGRFKSVLGTTDSLMNWWNMMEITFGTIWGAAFGAAVYRFRKEIRDPSEVIARADMPPWLIYALALLHLALLHIWTFFQFDAFDAIADRALPMGLIPLVLVVSGGWRGAALVALPLTAYPIIARTINTLCIENSTVALLPGSVLFGVIPVILLFAAMPWSTQMITHVALQRGVVVTAVLYFGLNFAFFQFPWPWLAPTGRTPSALMFTVDVAILLYTAAWAGWYSKASEVPTAAE